MQLPTEKKRLHMNKKNYPHNIPAHSTDSQKEQLFCSTRNPNIRLAREENVFQPQLLPEKNVYINQIKKTHTN